MKLVTWNIQACRGCDGVVSPRRIVETARALADFDVLCVQEVAANFPALPGSAGEDQFEALAQLLPGFELLRGVTVDTLGPQRSRRRFGNAIFSRLPVLKVENHRLPWPSDPQVRRSMPRGLLEGTLEAPWGPLRVMTTHLEFYSARQREAQLDAILGRHAEACLRAHEGQAVDHSEGPFHTVAEPASAILCGDFNMAPEDPVFARIGAPTGPPTAALVDLWAQAHPGLPRTPTVGVHDHQQWPRAFACDFVFATGDLAARMQRVEVDLQTSASDHQPVLVELAP